MTKNDLSEYRLRIGEAVVGIDCPSQYYAGAIARYFGVKSCSEQAHISLKLNIIPHEDLPELPQSLFTTKRLTPDGFSISEDLVRGSFSKEKQEVSLFVKNILTTGSATRMLEQVLYQAFYSARKICDYDAFLIHSSGVIRNDAGFLFVGKSGSGKSTIARLSRAEHVLNDEICLISFVDDNVIINSTPFNGYFSEKTEGTALLKAVFLLEHGPKHRLLKISGADAIIALMSQIVPPMALDEELTKEIRINMFEIASRLSKLVPVRRLEFQKDTKYWKLIDREFSSIERRNRGARNECHECDSRTS